MFAPSIFDGVISTENSYTNLLRNLLRIDADFAKNFIREIIPEALKSLADEPFSVQSQYSLRDKTGRHGIADLYIESTSFFVVVEIKVDPYCGTTPNQTLTDAESKGYIRYLRNRATEGRQAGIAFLVPEAWVHASDIRSQLDALTTPAASFTTWEKVRQLIRQSNYSPWVQEFRFLLEREFVKIELNQKERALLKTAPDAFSSTTRKLHQIVREVKKSIAVQINITGISGTRIEIAGDAQEYGAQLYREGRPTVWIGIWVESPYPFVAAVKESWDESSHAIYLLRALDLTHSQKEGWCHFNLVGQIADGEANPVEVLTTICMRLLRECGSAAA